ncbi:hypothetical protein ABTX60_21965 [Streptomyces sp. NPDC126510]|uniref:hypothetical protein n=1 Tax=Streptomyces sp. NPDC126510 TaxID=3155317 RepID=UPI00332B99E3
MPAIPSLPARSASKGGLDQLVKVMAREWAADGVNAVAPGRTVDGRRATGACPPGVWAR